MGANQIDVDPPGDQRFERRIIGRLAETVETPVLQVRNAWRELEAEQGAEREDVIGFTAAVRVMAADLDLALMIEQRVQDMQRLARRRRDHFREEWSVAVGKVSVGLEARLLAVMCVETARVTAGTARLEELAIRR